MIDLYQIRNFPARLTGGMIRAVNRILCLLALVSVALYGAAAGAAVARGPVMEMVICSGEGTATVMLDAKGDPVDPAECFHCPECLALAFGLPAGPDGGPVPPRPARMLARALPADLPAPRNHLRPLSRGPPAAQVQVLDPGQFCGCLPQVRAFTGRLEFGQDFDTCPMAGSGQHDRVAP